MRFEEIADFNPKTNLVRGQLAPFIDMAALPISARDIAEIGRREFKGSGSKFKDGDTLIARITPCLENGKGAKVSGLGPGIAGHGSTEFVVVRAKDGSDEDFVYYLSRHQSFRAYAEQHMLGTSGRQRVSWQSLAQFELDELDAEDRYLIGSLLACLDDKIENNRRMNETLEAMAQLIFRDWFVDFGPVHRKASGMTNPAVIMGGLIIDPEKAAQTAALFPDTFDDNGLPDGWEVEILRDVLELSYGKSLPKTKRVPGPFPVYGSGGVTGSHDEPMVKGPGIIVGRKGTVGSLYWEERDFFPIDTVFFVTPKNQIGLNYLWQLLNTLDLHNMNTDAAVPGLNRNNAYRLKISNPKQPLKDAFEGVAATLQKKLQANVSENSTLAETRDYLLPRLMSGQIRAGVDVIVDAVT